MTLDCPVVHPVHATLLKYSKHPSIIRFKERANETDKFIFQAFEYSGVWDEISHFNINKKTSENIPAHKQNDLRAFFQQGNSHCKLDDTIKHFS